MVQHLLGDKLNGLTQSAFITDQTDPLIETRLGKIVAQALDRNLSQGQGDRRIGPQRAGPGQVIGVDTQGLKHLAMHHLIQSRRRTEQGLYLAQRVLVHVHCSL